MNIQSKSPPRQAIDIDAKYLIARTFRELQRKRLPLDAASLSSLPFACRDGDRWRPTNPPYVVRAALSEMSRKYEFVKGGA